jgi:hypothetical protein
MTKRRTVAWLVAVAVGMMVIPAANAMGFTAAEKKHELKQNAAIGKTAKAAARALNRIAALTTAVGDQTKSLADLQTLTTGIDNRLKLIEGGVPQVLDGLTKLQAAALALKTGLETAGAGLVSLKTLATSTEYGIGQVFINGTAAGGAFVVTPDIPDAVQQAQTSQTFIAGSAGTLTVKVGVRSAESDGTGSSNPAAVCRVTVTAGNTGTTSAPNAGLNNAPFYPIDNKSPQTSTTETSFPFAPISTDQLTDLTTGTNSASPAGAATATAGLPYQVTLSCVDLSASTSDPSA